MHRSILGVGTLLVLAGCTGTLEGGQDESASAETDDMTAAGQEREFPVTVEEGMVRINVQVQRTSIEPSGVAIEVRDATDVLETKQVYLGAIGGRGEVAHESLVVDAQGNGTLVVVARLLEGEADVTVTSGPAAQAPHLEDPGLQAGDEAPPASYANVTHNTTVG